MTRTLIPNSTQVPDVILDRWLARLNGSEFKVVMYIARRTYGFGKGEGDTISLRQIVSGIVTRKGDRLDFGTGLNKDTVCSTLKALEKKGILLRRHRDSKKSGYLATHFRLNLDAAFNDNEIRVEPSPGRKIRPVPCRKKPLPLVGESDEPLSDLSDTQETDQQETAIQETAAATDSDLAPGLESNPAAAADLIEDLVSQHLNFDIAGAYARTYPDECKRQLAFVKPLSNEAFRSGKGAYLNRAIPGRYGPPKAFLELKAMKGGNEKLREERLIDEDAHRGAYRDYLKGLLRGVVKSLAAGQLRAFLKEEEDLHSFYFARSQHSERAAAVVRTFYDDERRVDRLIDFIRANRSIGLPTYEQWVTELVPGAVAKPEGPVLPFERCPPDREAPEVDTPASVPLLGSR